VLGSKKIYPSVLPLAISRLLVGSKSIIFSVAEKMLSRFSFPKSLIEIMSFWKKPFIFEPFIESYIQTMLWNSRILRSDVSKMAL